jgi:hypothetical protein
MTQEEKRIKIAEACGWTICYIHKQEGLADECYGCRPNSESTEIYRLPDYFGDLNAIREAVIALSRDQRNRYLYILVELVREAEMDDVEWDFSWCEATAAQRCEAFGRTLNLW